MPLSKYQNIKANINGHYKIKRRILLTKRCWLFSLLYIEGGWWSNFIAVVYDSGWLPDSVQYAVSEYPRDPVAAGRGRNVHSLRREESGEEMFSL